MTRRVPPSPQFVSDWKEWAGQLLEFIQDDRETSPETILLEHQIDSDPAKAIEDGLLMYDPSRNSPVYSLDGVWIPFGGTNMAATSDDFVSRFMDTVGDGTGTINANLDYSVTAGALRITSTASLGFDAYRMIVSIEDTSGMAAADYGNIAGSLTNGVVVNIEDGAGGVIGTLTPVPIKSNAAWGAYCYDVDIKTWGAGNELLLVRWTFERAGAPIRLRDGQELVIRFSDNLAGLINHNFLVQGLEVPS